jgi:hypothetical protein
MKKSILDKGREDLRWPDPNPPPPGPHFPKMPHKGSGGGTYDE